MKLNEMIDEELAFNTGFGRIDKFLDSFVNGDKYKGGLVYYMKLLQKHPGTGNYDTLMQTSKHTGLDFRQLQQVLQKAINNKDLPSHLAI